MKQRIAILTPELDNPANKAGDYFISAGISHILSGHYLERFSSLLKPTSEDLAHLQTFDFIIVCGSVVSAANRSDPAGFGPEDFQHIGKKVIPLGLGCQAEFNQKAPPDPKQVDLLRFYLRSSGPISVRDGLAHHCLGSLLGNHNVSLTGCPSLWAQVNIDQGNYDIFAPPSFHIDQPHSPKLRRWVRDCYQKLESQKQTVFLAQSSEELSLGAIPGWNTFCNPKNPDIHLRAIAASQFVTSFQVYDLMGALANGVDGLLLAMDEPSIKLAKTNGIPYLRWNKDLSLAKVIERIEQLRIGYPRKLIASSRDEHKGLIRKHLESRGLFSNNTKSLQAPNVLPVAVICDSEFVPSLMGLKTNLESVTRSQIQWHILTLDSQSKLFVKEQFPFAKQYELRDIIAQPQLAKLKSLPIPSQAYFAKPNLLSAAIQNSHKAVLFVDLDIYFYQAPDVLWEELNESPAMLFPHWNDHLENIHRHGIFNSGLLLVADQRVTDFWTTISGLESSSYYYEQGSLDLLPLYFPDIQIQRSGLHNVAHWSINSLGVQYSKNTPWQPLALGKPIQSFHASQEDPLGIFERKFSWDQIAALAGNWKVSSRGVAFDSIIAQQRNHWPDLQRLALAFDMVRKRLGLTIAKLDGSKAKVMVTGPGRHLLLLGGMVFQKLRTCKRWFSPPQATSNPWARCQHQQLLRLHHETKKVSPVQSGDMMEQTNVSQHSKSINFPRLD